MNSYGRFVAIFLTIIAILFYPLQDLAINQENVMRSHAKAVTKEFVDDIMLEGYLSVDMYESYKEKLSAASQLYNIELIHSKRIDSHDVGSLDISDKKVNISTAGKGKSEAIELSYTRKISTTIVANNNMEDNSIRLMSAHVHNDDCYAGHRHNDRCWGILPDLTNYTRGTNFWFKQYGSSSICPLIYMQSGGGPNAFNWIPEIYKFSLEYGSGTDPTVIQCKAIKDSNGSITFHIDYVRDVWRVATNLFPGTISFDDMCKLQTVSGFREYMKKYAGGTMASSTAEQTDTQLFQYIDNGTNTILICGQTQDETPICNQVVTSITATNPVQIVKQGENIISTATATMLDGSTKTMNCIVSGYNSNQIGTQTVTLTYSGLVNNAKTTGIKTCTITVTVKANNTPTSLTVKPSSYFVYNGSEPSYSVDVIYEDGSSKSITSGYSKDGFTTGAGIKTVNFSYTENEKTVSASITITVMRNIVTCPYGHKYELDDYDTDYGCPTCKKVLKNIVASPNDIIAEEGGNLNLHVTAVYQDGHSEIISSGWTSNYDSKKLGNQLVTITYEDKTTCVSVTVTKKITCPVCKMTYPSNVDGSDPGCPICSKTVTSIAASPDSQTLYLGDSLSLEVIATFKDGHKAVVDGWTSSFDPFKVGEQNVIIYYGTRSTSIIVYVMSDTEATCPICGTVYNPSEHPNGCPVCSETVVGIEAHLRNGGTQVQQGSELNIYVVLIYKDNHREIAYSDWIVEGYRANEIGKQILKVKYKEFSTNLTIEVINTLVKKTCPNGHVYYLNEDGSDPGCPYCKQDTSSDSALAYMDCVYTKVILKELYENGVYNFYSGDFITVTIQEKGNTIFKKLKSLFHNIDTDDKKYSYGGMIKYGKQI